MKKILLLSALALLLFGQAKAGGPVPIRWGVVGGMNVSSPNVDGGDSKIGFHIGAKADISLSGSEDGAYLYTGLLFSSKGTKASESGIKETLSSYNFDIPIHIGYKYALSDDITLFGNIGPYVGIGLFGKAKQKIAGIETIDVDTYGDDGALDRFDIGLGLQVGLEISRKIQLALGYDLGLTNIAQEGDYKNRNFMVSCAYMF